MAAPNDHNRLLSRGKHQHWQIDNHLDRTYDVTLYGAKGDGQTDDRKAIQDAIDAAYSAGGGMVTVPEGTYVVGSSGGYQTISGNNYPYALKLKQGVRVCGVGFQGNTTTAGGSVISLRAGQNCNIFITDNSAYTYGMGLEGMTLFGNKANNTAGTYGGHGIVLTSCDRPYINDCFISSCDRYGIYAIGSGGTYYALQPRISNSYVWGNNGGGIALESGSSDALITQCDIGQNGPAGLLGKGIVLSNGAIITDTAVWGNEYGLYGFYVQNITMAGCRVDYNIRHGVYLVGVEGMTLSGCNIYRNSAASPKGVYSGVYITGDGSRTSRSIAITGCRIGQESGADYPQKYGVEIVSATYCEDISIVGCDLKGNTTGRYYAADPSTVVYYPMDDTVIDDMVVSVNSLGLPAVSAPNWASIGNVRVLEFGEGGGEYAHFSTQTPHSYRPGTDLLWHVHFTNHDGTITTGSFVDWKMWYTGHDRNDTLSVAASAVSRWTAGATTATYTHCKSVSATIDGSDFTASAVVIGRIERLDRRTTGGYAGDVGLTSTDFHIYKSRLGTDAEYT